ncbi:MAG: hypothetical protein IJO48_06115 [Clostridia bacterium]|nr:hypothetical protein [Clostridia bacterium]
MKKLISILLVLTLAFAFAACGESANQPTATSEPTEEPAVAITDSLELLTNVWAAFAEDQKFAIAGGDYNNSVMDAPGTFNVSDTESLDSMLGVAADSAALIDGAASMMHMMNANTFTCGAYHIADAANVQAFADALKENIMNRQWMCGFPDTLVIYTVGGEYVVSAFGAADIITNFKANLATAYAGAELLYEENLAA